MTTVSVQINGISCRFETEPRKLLCDLLRDEAGLTSVHAACEQGSCGSCTVLVDGEAVLSCLMFGVQTNGRRVTTIEAFGVDSDHPIQRRLAEHGGVQCGYCTPGMVLAAVALLRDSPEVSATTVEDSLSGNLCRCTGYISIVKALLDAGRDLGQPGPP